MRPGALRRSTDWMSCDAAVNGFPLFHVGGTMTLGLSILAAGGHVIIPSPYSLRSPDAIRDYWHTVERFRATIVSGVPTSIAALAEVPIGSSDVSTVRMALTGGAVAPKAVSDRFQARTGITLFETYGMTETAAAIAFNPGRGTPVQGSVGFRAPFAKTKIVALADADLREECPPLSSGLVLVSGPQVFPGYVDPQHNKGVLTDDHWIVTGDVGYLTPDQRLVLTGREKDLIVRSGHNIDPAAIEDVANAFPGVQMSSAVGMPDAYAGEVPVLFVVPSPGQTIDLAQLREHLEHNVNEPPARPKRVVLLEALPVTAVGKIFKPTLRDLAVREKVRTEIDRILSAPTPRQISSSRKTRSSIQSSASRSIPVIWIEQRCSSKALQRFHKPIASRTDRPDGRATAGSKKGKTGMKRFRFNQQEIVFAVFALLFLVFSIFLRGFLTADNMLTLLQNVAVLGILGLAMAIVVIGRGIDISLIAALAVPPGWCCRWCRTVIRCRPRCWPPSLLDDCLRPRQRLADRLCRSPFAVCDAGDRPVARRARADRTVPARRRAMEPGHGRLRAARTGHHSRHSDVDLDVRASPASWSRSCCARRAGAPISMRSATTLTPRASPAFPPRPIIVLQYVLAALIGCFAGLVMAASVNSMPTRIFNSTLIYDVILVVVLGGIGLSGGRGGVLNVVIGTLLIGTMLNGMTIMDISYAGQNLIKGVVLLLAVITDSFLNPRNEETAQQGDI